MPRTYQPRKRGKRDNGVYTEETLQKCMKAVRSGSLSINKASKTYNIPRGTIQNKMKLAAQLYLQNKKKNCLQQGQ